MSLTQLGSTNTYVDLTKITAKTSVSKIYNKDKWQFYVLIDSAWVLLEYESESVANAIWASITTSSSSVNKGWYATETALTTAYPNGISTPSDRNGWFAIIGSTDTVWVWDADTNAWVDTALSGLVTSVDSQTGNVKVKDIISTVIDGDGFAITTGVKGDIRVYKDCTITRVTLLATNSGSIKIDIWKDTYANFPPTDADTITAGAEPEISSGVKYEDSTLTGWTKALSEGDILRINVDSCTSITFCALIIEVEGS